MKPTEAKKWIDRLTKTGLARNVATGIVDEIAKESAALAGNFANNFLQVAEAVSLGRNPAEPNPPPVEIPRRVVVQGEHGWGGKIGTVIGEDETRYHLRMETASKTEVHIIKSACTELRLSKEEQARLLLEKLSREDDTECDRGDERVRVFHKDGGWGPMPEKLVPHGTPFFKSYTSWSNARTAIIRAGLAWWDEEGQ